MHSRVMDDDDYVEWDALDGIDLDALNVLALTTAEIIASKYPGRVVLNPAEVADVWKGNQERATVNGIRDRLTAGTLIPGLKKNGGRWDIPVSDLIRVIDGLADEARAARERKLVLPSSSAKRVRSRHKAPIGYRPGIIGLVEQSVEAWREVIREMDLIEAMAFRLEMEALMPDKPDLPSKTGVV